MLTIYNIDLNTKLKEELLVTLAGPLFQILLTILINDSYFNSISYSLLTFNLLPIHPLDGSKLINILLNKFISYKKSYILTIYISLLAVLILITKHSLIIYISLLFLTIKIIKNIKQKNYIYNKFLLERYLKNYKFKKTKIINSPEKFKKEHKHIIKRNGHYQTEKEYLKRKFDFKPHL